MKVQQEKLRLKRIMEQASKIPKDTMDNLVEETRHTIQETIEDMEKLAAETNAKLAKERDRGGKWEKIEKMDEESGKDLQRQRAREKSQAERERSLAERRKRKQDEEKEEKLKYATIPSNIYEKALKMLEKEQYELASEQFYLALLMYNRFADYNNDTSTDNDIEATFFPSDAISNYVLCYQRMGKPSDGFKNLAKAYADRGQYTLSEEYMSVARKLNKNSTSNEEL